MSPPRTRCRAGMLRASGAARSPERWRRCQFSLDQPFGRVDDEERRPARSTCVSDARFRPERNSELRCPAAAPNVEHGSPAAARRRRSRRQRRNSSGAGAHDGQAEQLVQIRPRARPPGRAQCFGASFVALAPTFHASLRSAMPIERDDPPPPLNGRLSALDDQRSAPTGRKGSPSTVPARKHDGRARRPRPARR